MGPSDLSPAAGKALSFWPSHPVSPGVSLSRAAKAMPAGRLQGTTMTRLADEEFALIVADRHIADALQRIAKQERRVQDHREKGIESMHSDELLRAMREALCTFREHRRLIQEEIERQRRFLAPSVAGSQCRRSGVTSTDS